VPAALNVSIAACRRRDHTPREGRLENRIRAEIEDHLRLFEALRAGMLDQVLAIGRLLRQALDRGNKIMVAGNGGSAAYAQHFVTELVGRYLMERPARAAISTRSPR